MKHLFISLCIGTLLLILAGVALIYTDVEVRFFSHAAAVSEQWAAQLRKESASPLIVFTGGSEVRTCINPEEFHWRYGLRVVNAGQHAGFGLVCNVISAASLLRPGDTLVVSVVAPGADCDDLPLVGLRYLCRHKGVKAFTSPLFPLSAGNVLKCVRFNQQTDWAFISGLFRGDLSHCYDTHAELHSPSGWLEISNRADFSKPSPQTFVQERDYSSTLRFIQNLKAYCDARSVKLFCFLPWQYCHSAIDRHTRQQENLKFIRLLTQQHVSVLRDPHLGCEENADLFSDTILHMNRKGSELYAEILGSLLLSESCWRISEIEERLNK